MAVRGWAIAWSITSRISSRPFFAWARASAISAGAMPVVLMSICKAVIPLRVPATLKSMSP